MSSDKPMFSLNLPAVTPSTGSPFGASSGGFSFTPAASFGAKKEDDDEGSEGEEGEGGGAADADETHASEFKPLINLPEIEVKTMEEDEDVQFKHRAKLYIFVKEDVYGGEERKNWWRERGLGDIKILKHKTTGACRLLMRQEKTHKICLNHVIDPTTALAPTAGSEDKSATFTAADFDGEKIKTDKFAIKFGTPEARKQFADAFEAAKLANKAIKPTSAADVSEKLASLSVNKPAAAAPAPQPSKPVSQPTPAAAAAPAPAVAAAGGVADEAKLAAEFAVKQLGKGSLVKLASSKATPVTGTKYKMALHVESNGEVHAHVVTVFVPTPGSGEEMKIFDQQQTGVVSKKA